MQYPTLPPDLNAAQTNDLLSAYNALRQYKNVTILGISHWRAIPQLCVAAKQVNADQGRIMRVVRQRGGVFTPQAAAVRDDKPQEGNSVFSKFHQANGVVEYVEYSMRVGAIYHVRLDNSTMAYCHVSDLTILR